MMLVPTYVAPSAGFTTRNIEAGQELTCNYAEFDPASRSFPAAASLLHLRTIDTQRARGRNPPLPAPFSGRYTGPLKARVP